MNKEELLIAITKELQLYNKVSLHTMGNISDLIDRYHQTEVKKLPKHGVMQGCQCKDRIGETTVWCCNQCGLPCEHGWLPTYKPVRQPTVADGAAGKTVSEGNALQNFLKQEKETEEQNGKIFDE